MLSIAPKRGIYDKDPHAEEPCEETLRVSRTVVKRRREERAIPRRPSLSPLLTSLIELHNSRVSLTSFLKSNITTTQF